ncbi:hypothetical protein E2C01_012665 [Portunus trituberculatus]|uniref:Uncharacterized protein n=1 Tax=Portunus trituberculatus TaxID=210409 RepID=A0A5B7DEH3_PORTR|nr:hypothetical protein [Portunus trituberculatus]MPC19740.1 hypothetical protein [Portunus trituberculatus]
MSPFTQFFFKVMHIMCHNNFMIQCIPLFHHSMWKTVFANVLTHCLILIFFTCPHVLSSVTSTRSSLSIFSMPLTIFYIVIRSPRSLLSCKVSSPISFSRSSYVRSFSSSTIFVAIFCIRSNLLISFLELGDHTTAACSSIGRIMLVIIFLIISLFMN